MQKSIRLMGQHRIALVLVATILLAMGCSRFEDRATSVYVLAQAPTGNADSVTTPEDVIKFLLGNLSSGDSLTVARINNGSKGQKHFSAKVEFNQRPSIMVAQKRVFLKQTAEFTSAVGDDRREDITVGLLQAAQSLNQTKNSQKIVLIISDLNEGTPPEIWEDILFRLEGIKVVLMRRSKPAATLVDPERSWEQRKRWKNRIQAGGGSCLVINDISQLNSVLKATSSRRPFSAPCTETDPSLKRKVTVVSG